MHNLYITRTHEIANVNFLQRYRATAAAAHVLQSTKKENLLCLTN